MSKQIYISDKLHRKLKRKALTTKSSMQDIAEKFIADGLCPPKGDS
jgi:hypothetical protein